MEKVLSFLTELLPYIVPLVAVFLGYRLGNQKTKNAKRIELAERRLSCFYSPILGYIQKIIYMGEMRVDIHDAAQAAWRRICERHSHETDWDSDQKFSPFQAILEYDNEQLSDEIVPLFRNILAVFTKNFWLAFPSTQEHYKKVFDFVEVWNRQITTPLPGDIVERLNHSQGNLDPFFIDVIEHVTDLETFIGGDIKYSEVKK